MLELTTTATNIVALSIYSLSCAWVEKTWRSVAASNLTECHCTAMTNGISLTVLCNGVSIGIVGVYNIDVTAVSILTGNTCNS